MENKQSEKIVMNKILGKVLYKEHPVIDPWSDSIVGSRWEPEYTEEQKKILFEREEIKENKRLEKISAGNEFAKKEFGFDENDINDARDYFQSYIDLNNSSNEIEKLERQLKELKERKAQLSKKVSECDKKEFFENLAKNGCEAVKKANEVLKEHNLKALRFGELNSCYKFLNRN